MDENTILKGNAAPSPSSNNSGFSSKSKSNPMESFPNPFAENDQIIFNDTEDISTTPQKGSDSIRNGEINIPQIDTTNINETNSNTILGKIKKLPHFIGAYFQSLLGKLSDKIQVQSSYKYFLIFIVIGLIFMIFAVLSLPFILFNPSRLLSHLSIANIMIMISFLFYYGSRDFFGFLVDPNRTCVMVNYLISVFLGLFVSFTKGYFLSLLIDIVLIITTIMFILTLLPGGQNGIALIKAMLSGPILNLFNSFVKKGNKQGNTSDLPQ